MSVCCTIYRNYFGLCNWKNPKWRQFPVYHLAWLNACVVSVSTSNLAVSINVSIFEFILHVNKDKIASWRYNTNLNVSIDYLNKETGPLQILLSIIGNQVFDHVELELPFALSLSLCSSPVPAPRGVLSLASGAVDCWYHTVCRSLKQLSIAWYCMGVEKQGLISTIR